MNRFEAQEVACELLRDQHTPGGEVGLGYGLKLNLAGTEYETLMVEEPIAMSNSNTVTGEYGIRLMPFGLWMNSVAIACGIESDPDDMVLLETQLKEEINKNG